MLTAIFLRKYLHYWRTMNYRWKFAYEGNRSLWHHSEDPKNIVFIRNPRLFAKHTEIIRLTISLGTQYLFATCSIWSSIGVIVSSLADLDLRLIAGYSVASSEPDSILKMKHDTTNSTKQSNLTVSVYSLTLLI